MYLDYEKMFVNYNKLLKKDNLAEYANHEFNHNWYEIEDEIRTIGH